MNVSSNYITRIKDLNLIRYLPDVNMSERDKEIVSLYINGDATYQAIGEQYGISRERVRQLIVKFSKKALHFYNKEHLWN